GDGGCDYADEHLCNASNDAAQELSVLAGKVLRVTREGGIPAGNPYAGTDSVSCAATGRSASRINKCREVFASGLRNPFRFAFDPNAGETRFYVNDVGLRSWDEIDEGGAGANYGWPLREGHCTAGSTTDCPPPPPGLIDPIFDYGYGDGCRSITGGAFVPYGAWPSGYDGAYVFADYVCGKIFRLLPGVTGGFVREELAALGGNSATTLAFGPGPRGEALYYTSYANGGQVRRVAYTGTGNRTPSARLAASPAEGTAPLAVMLDAGASFDPNAGDTLTYEWSFGDGTPAVTTSAAAVTHTYAAPGTYTAELRVRDREGARSLPARVMISAAPAPSPAGAQTGGRRLVGTPGRDVLTGTRGNDVIYGRGGNDVLRGGGGNDRVYGERGHDRLVGGRGRDALLGGAGRDTLLARDGVRDRLEGGPGRDRARADRLRDRLRSIEVRF
ncbi:MAG: PKD domain-containing protein, partial [Chloroflexota bacterium]|nr:PKD domain-containing protein [Chloroflexota bacterium]